MLQLQESDADDPELWASIGTKVAHNKEKAIEGLAGELIGTFKAVPIKSWKGGRQHVEPTKSVESKPLED